MLHMRAFKIPCRSKAGEDGLQLDKVDREDVREGTGQGLQVRRGHSEQSQKLTVS